jgi:hypothetical protein
MVYITPIQWGQEARERRAVVQVYVEVVKQPEVKSGAKRRLVLILKARWSS